MKSSWEALRRRRALVCILNTFPLSHVWKSVDNMTDFERRLTQKMERYMTQCEHELLCGLSGNFNKLFFFVATIPEPPSQS